MLTKWGDQADGEESWNAGYMRTRLTVSSLRMQAKWGQADDVQSWSAG